MLCKVHQKAEQEMLVKWPHTPPLPAVPYTITGPAMVNVFAPTPETAPSPGSFTKGNHNIPKQPSELDGCFSAFIRTVLSEYRFAKA